MSQLKRNQVADAETVDFDWKGLCRIGGVAAWMQLLCFLVLQRYFFKGHPGDGWCIYGETDRQRGFASG